MALRLLLGLLIPLLFSAFVWADSLRINPNHPDQYTVVKGDTLWDISGKFLEHPWQWPRLWHNNPHIKNPHWIYPGDTLYFSYVDGEPRLSLTPEFGYGESPNLTPHIRESSIEQAIPMIPSDAITQFLSSPKVVAADELGQAPYVLEIADEHLVAGSGDRVYVRAIENPEGLEYTIYRQGKPYISPDTQEILGYEADYVADTLLESPGDPATLRITKSNSQVRRGDRLMLSSAGEMALNYFPRPPEQRVVGSIIRVMGGVSQIGQYDIVVIDKGTADGLEVGHTLDIYRKGRVVADKIQSDNAVPVKLPDELAGVLMVFRPFERVSYALVMKATSAIHTLDRVQTP
ncbi:LysM peptidoglycan-binding domain-containing protein [Methylomonas sp. SURF-2]|uniref:LysM peptidoglycan-binding domain-containing protein n=1 Tax=Methylomonas subterranea TaxID=2952225 RepID=A0ABT1TFW4_9GAMM|nr:LysM peptidoglycan-binding domain-containing protein [Methylomonas sp. SURF-2]MCQ8104353.1 LysM peptidoglycan-binding domain-containing protein [Methylomonas sp. SURF-2]